MNATGTADLNNCTFKNNAAGYTGGGILFYICSITTSICKQQQRSKPYPLFITYKYCIYLIKISSNNQQFFLNISIFLM